MLINPHSLRVGIIGVGEGRKLIDEDEFSAHIEETQNIKKKVSEMLCSFHISKIEVEHSERIVRLIIHTQSDILENENEIWKEIKDGIKTITGKEVEIALALHPNPKDCLELINGNFLLDDGMLTAPQRRDYFRESFDTKGRKNVCYTPPSKKNFYGRQQNFNSSPKGMKVKGRRRGFI